MLPNLLKTGSLLCLLLTCAFADERRESSLLAFSSLDVFGGAYHSRITRDALSERGMVEASLHWLCLGNVSMDKFYSQEFSEDHRHYTDMTFEESENFLEDSLEDIVEGARGVRDDYQVYRETLVSFGEYLHTVQDFYAHTNWIEKWLAQDHGEPVGLAPIDFEDFPFDLTSPYTLNRYLPPGEVTQTEDYRREFHQDFYSVDELAQMTDRDRISLAASPKKALNHLTLAKDNPDYAASKLRWKEDGPTLFEIAVNLATRDTVRQWDLLRNELVDEWGERGIVIGGILDKGWASGFPIPAQGQGAVTVDVSNGEIRLSNDLNVSVRLTLRPSGWDQGGATKAMALFSRLSRPESEQRRFSAEGVRGLRMVRDDQTQSFRLAFEANLFGGARTLLKLRPLSDDSRHGNWEGVLRLPEELSTIEGLILQSNGQVALKDGAPSPRPTLAHGIDLARSFANNRRELRFVIAPPKGGWNPPDWLREYLRDPDLQASPAPRRTQDLSATGSSVALSKPRSGDRLSAARQPLQVDQ